MNRQSQYLQPYLASNKARGLGKGITPGSFLTHVLRGKAKQWAGSYRTSLCRSLQTAVSNGLAIVGPSHGGKEAFYPKESNS